ncbi:MAG: hypothetical protein O7A68_07890 [Alphaproteobacteria bacterium]|nr:hypothetical protein [Alphaproteobacteria bacterium]
MMRPFDWQSRMAEALAARRESPFAWGRHDCALFACDVAEAVCGIDFAASLRGRYGTKRGAYAALKRFAGGELEKAAERIARDHGCPEVAPLMARRGDIVLAEIAIDGGSSDALGICLGEWIAFAAGRGFVQLPLTKARRAWRVP